MVPGLEKLEAKLEGVLVKSAPKLPSGGKKLIVEWAPLVSLILGVVALLSAWSLWRWAHAADDAIRGICNAYSVSGCGSYAASRYTFWLWLGIAVLAAEGVLYLMAYQGLRERKKAGWNYLYYGALLSLAYVVVSFFSDYKAGSTLGSIIGSVVGLYFLFQVREFYTGHKQATADKDNSKK